MFKMTKILTSKQFLKQEIIIEENFIFSFINITNGTCKGFPNKGDMF